MSIFDTPRDNERSDRSVEDRARHRQKVRRAIKENISDIIAQESIIGKDRDRIIKVPLRGIKEYRFVYGTNEPGVGQGGDDAKPGDVISREKKKEHDRRSGDHPGMDYYETDVTLDEIIDIMFEDLELPYMERKGLREIEIKKGVIRKGYRKKGIWVHLSRQKTQRKKIKRRIKSGLKPEKKILSPDEYASLHDQSLQSKYRLDEKDGMWHFVFSFHQDDLTYHHRRPDIRRESNAVVFCIMDTSGSMDMMKKYLARSFFFLLYQFILSRYQRVEVVFISHHTQAAEVTEDEFFHKGESGGTFISSGYRKALEIIEKRYHPSLWNIYAFHCSDGDNFETDNSAALQAAGELTEASNLFGYGEIKPLDTGYYGSSMIQYFSAIDKKNFATIQIKRKEDVWPAFKAFLAKERTEERGERT